jgi:hypothetical protein
MTASMQEAADLYEAAGVLELERICVSDDAFRSFSLAVRALQDQLGDDASDSYWLRVLARLRRLRWELATVPLPFGHPAFEMAQSAAFLSEQLRDCERVFPAHAAAAREAIARLLEIASGDRDPLGAATRALVWRGADRALVLRDARHATAVSESVGRSIHAHVLPAAQLPSARVFGEAAVIGPTCWFPTHVFTAPRARLIHIIHFNWLSDPPLDARIFSGSELGAAAGRYSLPAHSGLSGHGLSVSSVDFLPVTDWAAIASGTGGSTDRRDDRPDTVDAYLFLLASEQAVYLEAEEGSRAYVVELGTSKDLHMVATRSIQPGTYVVSRVGGEGDYIPAIADSLLGSQAAQLRAVQRRWKERLGDLVRTNGVQGVLSRLEAAGSPRASRGNLRRWASASSIRTEDYTDFAALMRVIGLGVEATELWRQMDLIDQAHLRAGRRVRALLVREILDGDTRELEEHGWQDYDVPEIQGEGSLRVARVEARAPETVQIAARQTRQLLPVERDLWQG